MGSTEQSRMAGRATQQRSVFIIHFGLDEALAVRILRQGGRNVGMGILGWVEERARHLQRSKYLSSAELGQRLTGDALDRLAQDNESDVTIFGALERIGHQRRGQGSRNGVLARFGDLPKFAMSGKPG